MDTILYNLTTTTPTTTTTTTDIYTHFLPSPQDQDTPPITKKLVIVLLAVTFFIFSVGGNGLVILAYFVDKNVRTPSNLYLVCLAWVDLLIGLTNIPFGFLYNYNGGWYQGKLPCQLWLMCCYGLSFISSAHLVLIAIDRHRIISEGVSYLHKRKVRHVLEASLIVWAIGIWFAFPVVLDWEYTVEENFLRRHCVAKKTKTRVMFLGLITFILPGLLMLRLYVGIFFELRRRHKAKLDTNSRTPSPRQSSSNSNTPATPTPPNPKNRDRTLSIPVIRVDLDSCSSDAEQETVEQMVRRRRKKISLKQERNATLTLGVLIGLFLLCWAPYMFLFFRQAFQPDYKPSKILNSATALIAWINSCTNPIVYAKRSKDFKKAFRKIFTSK